MIDLSSVAVKPRPLGRGGCQLDELRKENLQETM